MSPGKHNKHSTTILLVAGGLLEGGSILPSGFSRRGGREGGKRLWEGREREGEIATLETFEENKKTKRDVRQIGGNAI